MILPRQVHRRSLDALARRFAVVLLALVATAAQAQTWSGSLSVALAVPQGDFAERIEGVGFGGSGLAVLHFADLPLGLGAEGAMVTYGRETLGEGTDVIVETTNNIVLGHLLLRLHRPDGLLRPYADALVGGSYFLTGTQLKGIGGESVSFSSDLDDLVFSYGVGAGLMVRVRTTDSESSRRRVLFVDARLRYMLGGEAEYLREVEVGTDGALTNDVTRSATNLLMLQLGATFQF